MWCVHEKCETVLTPTFSRPVHTKDMEKLNVAKARDGEAQISSMPASLREVLNVQTPRPRPLDSDRARARHPLIIDRRAPLSAVASYQKVAPEAAFEIVHQVGKADEAQEDEDRQPERFHHVGGRRHLCRHRPVGIGQRGLRGGRGL